MSGILAVFNRDGQPLEPVEVDGLIDACPERAVDGQAVWVDGSIALGHQHFWVAPEDRAERQPLVDPVSERVISADVRLDNRAELFGSLGLAPESTRGLSDTVLVLRAYRKWGVACVERLLGDFVFAIWDGAAQGLFVARDALGSRSVCYYLDARYLVAASEIAQILAHRAVHVHLNERKVADHLAFLFDDHEQTFYKNVYYLPPAHCLWVSAGTSRRWRYWELAPKPLLNYRRDEEYAEHFLALLRAAVRCRMRSSAPIGLSLSGGLDSTLLAALASEGLSRTEAPQRRLKSF